MRRIKVTAPALLALLCAESKAGYGHALLGHHWEDPVYVAEMRFQVVLMAGIFCAAAAVGWIRRMCARRRVER